MKSLILAPEYFNESARNVFSSFSEVDVKKLDKFELLSFIKDYEVIAIRVDTKVDKDFLNAATKLKVIVTATIGLDHIDVEYAKSLGIEVVSLQGGNVVPTAEYVFALMLSLLRKVPSAHSNILKGKWERHNFIGENLSGKVLGVVGFGRIGQHVAKIAQAFGMKVVAYDPYVDVHVFVNNNVQRLSMNDVLACSDVVTLHMLLTEETKGMFTKEKFEIMKNNAVFVNCSRGGVVDESALVNALESKAIGGAALDVFVDEPLSQYSRLVEYAELYDNLILTPHIAGSTKESVHEAGLDVAEKARRFLE